MINLLWRIASVLSWVLGTLLFFFHGSLLQYLGGLALCALGYVLWEPLQTRQEARHDAINASERPR